MPVAASSTQVAVGGLEGSQGSVPYRALKFVCMVMVVSIVLSARPGRSRSR